jgi:hypothetical protein
VFPPKENHKGEHKTEADGEGQGNDGHVVVGVGSRRPYK